MALKAMLVYSNDDGFSLGVQLLRATVAERVSPDVVDHQVVFHEALTSLTDDYLGHYTPLLARIFAWRPDVISFSTFVWNHDEFARLGQLIRRHLPRTVIVWGGGDVSSRRRAGVLLERYPWLDLILRGEAEDTYPQLLAALAGGDDLGRVAGLSRRLEGAVVHAPEPADVDLAALPVVFDPATLPLDPIFARRPDATLAYETGRGCRQKCRFCLYSTSKLRAFPMDRVEAELTYLLGAGVPKLRICDAHLGISRPRAMEVLEIIAAHNRRTAVNVYPDTKHVDLDYTRALGRANCRVVSLGIQSSDGDTLAIAGRRFDRDTFARATRLLRRHHNDRLSADVIIGMPGDNLEKVRNTITFAFRSGVDKVHFAPLMAFPGTDFYEYAEEYGLEWFDFAPPLVVESRGFPAQEYRQAIVLAQQVEALQDGLPMVVRCLSGREGEVVELAERVSTIGVSDVLGDGGVLAWLADRPDADRAVLDDALAWDRRMAEQRLSAASGQPDHLEDGVVDGVDPTRVLWCHRPVHVLVRDHEVDPWTLPTGRFGYLFPAGGLAVYRVDPLLLATLSAATPGRGVAEIRDEVGSAVSESAGAGVTDALRLLCLAGVLRIGRRRPDGDAPRLTARAAAEEEITVHSGSFHD